MNIEEIGGLDGGLYDIIWDAHTTLEFDSNKRLKDNWSWHPDLFANLSNMIENET